MATVYSLICWGGLTGKSVTGATVTDIITSTNHGLRTGTALVAQSTVSGVTSGTTYYASYIAANTFYLYDTLANAQSAGATGRINITATTAFYLKSKKMIDYFAAYSGRWGASGSERCYDGIVSASTVRTASATAFNQETIEIGEAFTDITNFYNYKIAIRAPLVLFTTMVAGALSEAFHGGVVGAGFIVTYRQSAGFLLSFYNHVFEGFSIKAVEGANGLALSFSAFGSVGRWMILQGPGSSGTGVAFVRGVQTLEYSLIFEFITGLLVYQYEANHKIRNNTFVKNGYGVYGQYGATNGLNGFWYNNLIIGSATANWPVLTGATEDASNNAGLAGEAWITGANPRIEIGTDWNTTAPLFMDYTNNDFRPYKDGGGNFSANSSLIVDGGIAYYGAASTDISGGAVPNYMNGGAEAVDIGCYEFDHGYGLRPASTTLTLTNLVADSRVHIETQSGSATYYDQIVSAGSTDFTFTVYGDARDALLIRVRKGSAAPKYLPFETQTTITTAPSSIYVSQVPDTIAS